MNRSREEPGLKRLQVIEDAETAASLLLRHHVHVCDVIPKQRQVSRLQKSRDF